MKKTLSFIFLVLLGLSSQAQEMDCEPLKDGFFEYGDLYPTTVIYREGGYQIEYDVATDKWVVIQLKWLSDCKYTFSYVKTNDKELKDTKDMKVEVTITNINEKGYDYVARVYGLKKDLESSFYFLTMPLDDKTKEKIKKKLRKFIK